MAQPARAKIAASLLISATALIANPASALVPQANTPLQHYTDPSRTQGFWGYCQ